MFRDILESIPGIHIFPILGLVLFMIVFLAIVFWVFVKLDKNHVARMGALPLDSSPFSSRNGD